MQDNLITIISGAGLGAILSAVLVFFNNSKRNTLDYIVRERSEWRKELQEILDDLFFVSKRSGAVDRLKNRINPYGKFLKEDSTQEYYLKDGHIWTVLQDIEINKLDLSKMELLENYIRLLWKYDWEKSKKETKYNILASTYCCIIFLLGVSLLAFLIMDTNKSYIGLLLSFIGILFHYPIISKYNKLRLERRKNDKGFFSKEGLKQYLLLICLCGLPVMMSVYYLVSYCFGNKVLMFNINLKIVNVSISVSNSFWISVVILIPLLYMMFVIIRYLSTAKIEYILQIRSAKQTLQESNQN
ncbi:TPA: hypothetical protein ACHVGQ_000156 [Streptococcus suis]